MPKPSLFPPRRRNRDYRDTNPAESAADPTNQGGAGVGKRGGKYRNPKDLAKAAMTEKILLPLLARFLSGRGGAMIAALAGGIAAALFEFVSKRVPPEWIGEGGPLAFLAPDQFGAWIAGALMFAIFHLVVKRVFGVDAVKRIQAEWGLEADGYAGPQTEAALLKFSGDSAPPAATNPGNGEPGAGQNGAGVLGLLMLGTLALSCLCLSACADLGGALGAARDRVNVRPLVVPYGDGYVGPVYFEIKDEVALPDLPGGLIEADPEPPK